MFWKWLAKKLTGVWENIVILQTCLQIIVINAFVLFEKINLELIAFAILKTSDPYVEQNILDGIEHSHNKKEKLSSLS